MAALFSVVALILNKDGLVLAVSRKGDHSQLGLPGGKIEPGESPEEAVRREVQEECDLRIVDFQPFFDHVDRVEGGEKKPCRCFLVTRWEGTPRSMEGAWVGWVSHFRLLQPGPFAEYNRAVFTQLFGQLSY